MLRTGHSPSPSLLIRPASALTPSATAEYLAVPEDGMLATMPANLTFEEAAASTEGSHYVLWFIRKAKIRSGQVVLSMARPAPSARPRSSC